MVLSATSNGLRDEFRSPRAVRTMLIASWQIVGSSKVGFRGLGLKIGGRPMPETMSSTTVFEVAFLPCDGGARVRETH